MWRVVVVGLLANCSTEAETGPTPTPLPVQQPIEAHPRTDEAIAWLRAELEVLVAADVALAELPEILWFEGLCIRYEDLRGCDQCRAGCTHHVSGGEELELHVARPDWAKPSDTALTHELIHWALWVRDSDTDGDHLDSVWSEEVSIELALVAEGL